MDQAAEPVPPQDPDIRAMGGATIVEIIAEYDPFHAKAEWGDLRSELGSRVTPRSSRTPATTCSPNSQTR